MRKFIKNNIFGFILGIILCSGIIYGANTYESNSIEYSPTDASWDVNNVGEALNGLYNSISQAPSLIDLGNFRVTNPTQVTSGTSDIQTHTISLSNYGIKSSEFVNYTKDSIIITPIAGSYSGMNRTWTDGAYSDGNFVYNVTYSNGVFTIKLYTYATYNNALANPRYCNIPFHAYLLP